MTGTSRGSKPGPADLRPVVSSPETDPADDRPTGDDRAQAALGGPKGSPALKPAPMTPARAKKTPRRPGGGHTA